MLKLEQVLSPLGDNLTFENKGSYSNYTAFGLALKALMVKYNCTAKQLSRATEYSQSFISAIMTGGRLVLSAFYSDVSMALASYGATLEELYWLRVGADVSNHYADLSEIDPNKHKTVLGIVYGNLSKKDVRDLSSLVFA